MTKTSIIIIASLFAFPFLQACSGPAKEDPAVAGARSTDAGMSKAQTNQTLAPDPPQEGQTEKIDSIYTDLASSKCKTTELNEDEGWSVQLCRGAFGYDLEVTEGDLRQSVTVIGPGGKRHELNFPTLVSAAFSSVGEKAEWRFREEDGKREPFALIIRFNASEDAEDSSKVTSYLTVSKITEDEICLTDIVKPVRNANEQARELALGASDKPCLMAK